MVSDFFCAWASAMVLVLSPFALTDSYGWWCDPVNTNNISFSIIWDSLAALYDVYLIIGQKAYADRIQRPEAGDIAVTIKIEQSSETA